MPVSFDENGNEVETLFDGCQLVPKYSGFRMDGFFVWCGSVIEVDGIYHMFASRWPKETGFPRGYFDHSEIVRATSDNPIGPYTFQEVVTPKRGGEFWDGKMTHNPSVYEIDGMFVLFHNGSAEESSLRKVGYATASSVGGPWIRSDNPLPLSEDANNPAACFDAGGVKLAFRDRELKMGIAEASHVGGNYTVQTFDIMPEIKLEDPYFYFQDGVYHIVCEDNRAQVSGHERWGVHLVSEDGITRWRNGDPLIAYTHTVVWDDGSQTTFERRERPQLIFNFNGQATHLCTAVLFEGNTWCMVQPIE